MVLKKHLIILNQFFFLTNRIRKFYLNSKFYNKKISKINNRTLYYKPSLNLLSCLIKYDKKNIILKIFI